MIKNKNVIVNYLSISHCPSHIYFLINRWIHLFLDFYAAIGPPAKKKNPSRLRPNFGIFTRRVAGGLGRHGHQRAVSLPQREHGGCGGRLLQSASLPVPVSQTQGTAPRSVLTEQILFDHASKRLRQNLFLEFT